MPKFTFIGEHTDLCGNPNGTKVTYEFHVETLNDILEHADLFIRGCGYMPQGTLDYVVDENEDNELHDDLTLSFPDGTEEIVHSKYYYDTERNK